MLVNFVCAYFLTRCLHKVQPVRLTGDLLEVNLSYPASILEARGLVKLGRFSGDYLALSSWWIILSEKLVVSVRMELVTDMSTDVKRQMRPNTFGVPFPLSSFCWIFLLRLNPEMRGFVYYGVRREDCEGPA